MTDPKDDEVESGMADYDRPDEPVIDPPDPEPTDEELVD